MNVLIRKYKTLKSEASVNKIPLRNVIAGRVKQLGFRFLLLAFNFSLLFVTLPLLLLAGFILMFQRKRKSSKILFVGLEHIIKKTTDRAQLFSAKGYQVNYYSLESTQLSIHSKASLDLYKYSPIIIFNIWRFIKDLYLKRVCYVEIYLETPFLELLIFQLYCKAAKTICIVIERGMMINLELKNVGFIFTTFLSWIYKFSDKVYYREPYMIEHFKKLNISEGKLFFDHNRIPVSPKEPLHIVENQTILFLNSFVPSRRLDVFIGAIPKIQVTAPDAVFIIVGARSQEEMNYACHLLDKCKVTRNVTIHKYIKDTKPFFEQASIFAFPSDFVFANFSLLEAMERGLVPVVSNVRDANRIVDHGINGFLVEQDSKQFANYCCLLLKDKEKKYRMSIAARETIINFFNDKTRIDPIDQMIRIKFFN